MGASMKKRRLGKGPVVLVVLGVVLFESRILPREMIDSAQVTIVSKSERCSSYSVSYRALHLHSQKYETWYSIWRVRGARGSRIPIDWGGFCIIFSKAGFHRWKSSIRCCFLVRISAFGGTGGAVKMNPISWRRVRARSLRLVMQSRASDMFSKTRVSSKKKFRAVGSSRGTSEKCC